MFLLLKKSIAFLAISCSLIGLPTFYPVLKADTQFSVASINLNRFFDNQRDRNGSNIVNTKTFKRRVKYTARYFVEKLNLPDIIAIQEIENLNSMDRITDYIESLSGEQYINILLPGNDSSGINLGFMIKKSFRLDKYNQLFKKERLNLDGSDLFSRPPLLVRLCQLERCLSVVNVHLRSMRGISRSKKADRNRLKRLHQAQRLASWINREQQLSSDSLAVLGDFNALKPSDRWVDVIGIIEGKPDNKRPLLKSRDLVNPDLVDTTLEITRRNRVSFNYRGKYQQLDYLFVNSQFDAIIEHITFLPIDRKLSDHAALIANMRWK